MNNSSFAFKFTPEMLKNVKLNNFKAFERILFIKEERKNENRWEKFGQLITLEEYGDVKDIPCRVIAFLPFTSKDLVARQINHYILWGVIAYFGLPYKPIRLYNYNNPDERLYIKNNCFACEGNEKICCDCPIWINNHGIYDCKCETGSKEEYEDKRYFAYRYFVDIASLCDNESHLLNNKKIKKLVRKTALQLQTIEWREV